jgi:predicted TIM-barrel fold metal-dependent hydrolase
LDDAFARFDAHVHVGAWRTPDFAGHASGLDDVRRVLAESGITGALVMPTDDGDNPGLLGALEASHGTEAGPELLMAAWCDPHRPDETMAFLESAGDRVRALKCHPSFARLPLTAPAYRPFLAYARDHDLPVVTHCGRWREVAGWEIALAAAEAFPTVPFVLSHMGGDGPLLVAGAAAAIRERGLFHAYLGTESIREPWVVDRALEMVGPERLVFGSDHNLNHPAAFLAVIDALHLTPAAKTRILGGNARILFAPASMSPPPLP